MQPNTAELHRYRVHLIPKDIAAEDVEQAHNARLLPFHQFPAPDATWAATTAHEVSGLAVHSVDRLDASEVAA